MKIALIFIAIIGVSLASPSLTEVKPNADDLRFPLNRILENVDLVNLDRVLQDLFGTTDQGAIILLYLRGKGFGRILDFIRDEVPVQETLDYIEQNGIEDVRDFIAQVLADLGIPRPTSSPRDIGPQATFEELLIELAACINTNGLIETALDVINNDLAVINFLNYLSRPEMAASWQRIKAQPDLGSLLDLLQSAGIDVETVLSLIEAILGWGETPRHVKF